MSASTLNTPAQTFIQQDGWQSFSEQFPDSSKSATSELLDRYATEVAAESSTPLSEKNLSLILIRNVRDLFMAYSILGNQRAVTEVLEICRLFSIDPELTFDDINEMLKDDFDPFCLLNARLYLRKMSDDQNILTVARHRLNGLSDQEGDQLKEMLSFQPLRLYRTVFHLKRIVPGVKPIEGPLKGGEEIRIPSAVYFGILLKHHTPLIDKVTEMFNLFFTSSRDDPPNVSADQVHDTLSRGSGKSAKAKTKELNYLKMNTSESFFPLLTCPVDVQIPKGILPVDLDPATSLSGKKKRKLFQQLLDEPRTSMLPTCFRKGLIEYQVSVIIYACKGKPAKILAKLNEVLMTLYGQTDSKEQFLGIIPPIVHHINLLSYELSKQSIGFANAWEKMLEGSLSKHERAVMINQLNSECTRLFRSLNIFDLCDRLDKFCPKENASTPSAVIERPALRRSQKQLQIKAQPKPFPVLTPITASSSQSFTTVHDKLADSVKLESANKSTSCPNLLRSQSVLSFTPNQLSLDEISNRITDALVYHLLNASDDKAAVKIAMNAIQFAVEAIDGPVANFHVARSIYFAFCNKSITRLKFLQSSLHGQTRKNFNRLQELFALTGNFSNFREAMRNCDRPYIPHIGLYKSDFTFGTEAEETEVQKEFVQVMVRNFEKMTALLKVAVPIVPPCTDCIEYLNSFELGPQFPKPATKIDIESEEKWEEGEWEALPSEEKCWFVSTSRWPSQS